MARNSVVEVRPPKDSSLDTVLVALHGLQEQQSELREGITHIRSQLNRLRRHPRKSVSRVRLMPPSGIHAIAG
jgi:hypothetical protein